MVKAFSALSLSPHEMLILRVTISYVTVAIGQYGTLLSVRNRRVSILQSNPLWGPRRNLLVLVGMTGTVLICIVNLYGAGFQRVFYMRPIPGMFWGLPFAFALGILLVDETRKAIVRKYPKVCFKLHDRAGTRIHTSIVFHCVAGMVNLKSYEVGTYSLSVVLGVNYLMRQCYPLSILSRFHLL